MILSRNFVENTKLFKNTVQTLHHAILRYSRHAASYIARELTFIRCVLSSRDTQITRAMYAIENSERGGRKGEKIVENRNPVA